MSLSAVLPLKYEAHKTNSFQQCQLLFQSLLKFGQNLHFEEFLIVVPRQDLEAIANELTAYSEILPIHYVDENRLIPDTFQIGGWRKQQLIKLAISSMVTAKYYITFDADALLKKEISNADLLPNGKALLQNLPKSIKPDWWTGSGKILSVDIEMEKPGMDVTPAILHTESVEKLKKHLERISKRSWIKELLKTHRGFPYNLWTKSLSWTEYSLYFLYLTHFAKIHEVHEVSQSPVLLSKKSVWSNIEFENWDVQAAFEEDPSPFLVIQSNKQLPIEQIRDKLQPFIN